jgi:hypothetical protein
MILNLGTQGPLQIFQHDGLLYPLMVYHEIDTTLFDSTYDLTLY